MYKHAQSQTIDRRNQIIRAFVFVSRAAVRALCRARLSLFVVLLPHICCELILTINIFAEIRSLVEYGPRRGDSVGSSVGGIERDVS